MVGSTRYGPIVMVAAMLALGGVYLAGTIGADRSFEAKIFPLACGVVFVALLVWEGIAMLAKRTPAPDAATAGIVGDAPVPQSGTPAETAPERHAGTSRGDFARFVGLVLLITLFAYVATQVDYVLGTAVFMAVAMWLIAPARRSWTAIVLVTVVSVIAVNLIFVQVLSVRLPSLIPGL
jgi:Tripartite tricarboxylate transporter TctB family